VHGESRVGVAIGKFGNPGRGTSAIGRRYPRSGKTADRGLRACYSGV
jgi:hypothetical protein